MKKSLKKQRTFAIISHPDAGKTTLTEKFLLYGGAIQQAGQVRAKGAARRSRSDFMKLEKERGISVSTSAMSFSFEDFWINLVDTPGHSDFSEDTYRTMTAVDSSIMVIDGAKGVESQTKKLFEVCFFINSFLPSRIFGQLDRKCFRNLDFLPQKYIEEKLILWITSLEKIQLS